MANIIILNNSYYCNIPKKSIPGDVQAQVLQEPVGASHADQGRKSGMLHPFLDPGGQAGSSGTPHLTLQPPGTVSQGGGVGQILIYIATTTPLGNPRGWPKPQVWGTIGSGLTPRVQNCVRHSRFPALISVGGADRFLEDLSPDIPRD